MSKKDSSYKGKNTRNAYGTFQNVFLSANDYDELKDKLQDRLDELIDRLSCYIESSGKKYKSHKATILLWYEDDKRKKINESPNKRVYTLDDYKIRY